MASNNHATPLKRGAKRTRKSLRDAASSGVPSRIVGLGASAGGLEAFEGFFRNAAKGTGMGFVLVQHLDPSHASMLVEILQRVTGMPVVEATDQMPVLSDRVHVIPPNRDMAILDGKLQLTTPAEPHGLRMPIDAFFRSLAEDQGERAVGIVLSGTGTDGTLGLRAIFGAGGLCLAQEPASAKFDGMPASAIKAGFVNQVLPVEKMAQALLDAGKVSLAGKVPAAATGPSDALNGILAQLRAAIGHDFSLYKKSTIGRRVERRMVQHGITDIAAYARYARENPGELQALFRELLINVTSFFRNPEAFETLKREILPALLRDKPQDYTLRIWVAGCATGEEVYSIAIVVREWMDDAQRDFKVQLFGTDLDDNAIKIARAGLYPPNIAQDLSAERLRRFFIKSDAGYRVKKELRDMAVFAVQSIIKDPPFTRLDLLCCRNVLIYLEPELQNRLIPSFHYALNPGGILFLSPSESIGSHLDLFDTLDRKWKFYRAKATPVSSRRILDSKVSWATAGAALPFQDHVDSLGERHVADLVKRTLLQSFTPAAVLTDLQGNVLYVHGDTGRYLRPAPGHPTHSVIDMAREGLQIELREALRVAASQGTPTVSRVTIMSSDGEPRQVDLNVRSLPDPDVAHSMLLVSFQAVNDAAPTKPSRPRRGKLSAEAQRCGELERELAQAKASLRTMLEEQQISNEELKSANEELQSTNEELQSTNEELETSKEELQSVNEELVTVNSELHTKIEQMTAMADDMKNLLDNLRLGTVFLDRNLLVRRFTRDATKVFRLVAGDVGRPLADIRSELLDCDLVADAQIVLDSLVPTEREARSAHGEWYLARIQPYRTVDNVIDGVVLTFADVTERVNAIAAHEARVLAEAIVDAVASPLAVLDGKHRVVSVNRAFYEQFHDAPDNTVGADIYELGNRRWDMPGMHELLEAPWDAARGAQGRQVELSFGAPDATRHKFEVRRVVGQTGKPEVILLSISPVLAPAAPLAG